ncbi:hypothetical protein [Streptomyces sp. NPDC059786]|uniref:hypothetical protein n=1 Tax=Streptomyces sp. NPDC059786 TaxID=3346946 RepID=UPI003663A9D4
MGLDITVVIADWSWLDELPPPQRLPRLRDAWYADETGLWDHDAPTVEGDWVQPRGRNGTFFTVYEFRHTLGSYKAHFWAGQRWEAVRGHVGPSTRTELDTFLSGLIWDGPNGEAQHIDPPSAGDGSEGSDGSDGHGARGVLLARTPASARELAATWERVRPRLTGIREAFAEHAAVPEGWIGDFDAFAELLREWGHVVTEAAGRGWGVIGLSE